MIGKAIYTLITDVTDGVGATIGTRCYPMTAPQGAEYPLVTYEPSSPQPSDNKEGPSELDTQNVEVVIYTRKFSEGEDIASQLRAMFDRFGGMVSTVPIQSVQFENQSYEHYPEIDLFAIVQVFKFRIVRDTSVVVTGLPLEQLTLDRLDDVTIDDPIDRQVLAYDEATGEWINDGAGSISIPVFNETNDEIERGRPLTATGSQGDRIAVSPYSNIYEELRFVGIAGETIPARSNGHATVYGEIRMLDTSNFEVGDFLYPVTGTNPTFYPYGLFKWTDANDSPLVCAIVTRKQQNTGRIFVRMWSPGYRNELRRMNDVQISTEFEGALLKYDSSISKWAVPPQTSKLILEDATETVEIYYYSKTTDTQQYRDPQSDTPSAGNYIKRKIWYSVTAQDDIDSGTWILLQELDDDATYAQLVTAFESQLNTSPAGDTPVSIKTTWEDLPLPTTLLATYPGAAAAYSLRLIGDGDYTGSAIRVRRASDNTEQDIGFDAGGDLDTSALATFCAGTDGFVKTWYDQSGNGNDATQTTTGSQPKIYDSVNGVIEEGSAGNEKPAIEFDGDKLEAPNTTTEITFHTSTQGMLFAALNVTANTGAYNSIAINNEGGSSRSGFAFAVDDRYTGNYGWYMLSQGTTAADILSLSNGASFVGTQKLMSVHYDLDSGIFSYANSSLLSSVTGSKGYGTAAATTNLGMGTIINLRAKMQELILYNSDDTNRTAIETNINDYYSIYTP